MLRVKFGVREGYLLWRGSRSFINGSAIFFFMAAFELLHGANGRAQGTVQQLFEEAQAARARGDFALAEQKYLDILRRAPQTANAYHNLGIVYFMQRKYSQSAAAFERATQLNPRLAEAYALAGLAYYELYAPDKAAAAFHAALRLNPRDSKARLYLGKSEIQMRDYREAAKMLEKVAASDPKNPDVLYSLSLSYMKLMLETVNRLGEVAPRSYQFFLLLAQDAEARGDDEAAMRNYQQALRVKPDATGAHYALGGVYARLGRYEQSAEEFKKELEIGPHDSLALWKLGELALRIDPEQARRYLEQAVSLDPDLPQAALAYGRALARIGQTEKAVETFQRVVALAPEEDSVHYHLANAYRRLGRNDEARAEMARFEKMAKKKSEKTRERARELIELSRTAQQPTEEPEPGFAPERDPTHH